MSENTPTDPWKSGANPPPSYAARRVTSAEATPEPQAQSARCSVALGSAAGFLEILAAVVEAERLVVAGLSKEMPCRKMHENRHRAFREALSMATAYFQPNKADTTTCGK